MGYWISSWVLTLIKSLTLMKDVSFHFILIGYSLQGQLNFSLGKKWSWYLPIGAWLVIALEALAHKVLKWPKCLSHVPPLLYNGSKILLSLSTSSRKLLSFKSDTWKVIFHLLMMLSHLFFLLKFQECLFERSEVRLNDLVSTSTILWGFYLHWLRHSQNLIEFS